MIHYSELNPEEKEFVSDGCGIVAKGLRVPDFIFRASCSQHDFYWCRGTGWSWNEVYLRYGLYGLPLLPYSLVRWYIQGVFWLSWANFWFFFYMIKDAFNKKHSFLEKTIYSFLATVYFLAVSVVALIPRTNVMCRWRSIPQILAFVSSNKKML